MKLWNVIAITFVLVAIFTINLDKTYAQALNNSPQIKILNNYGSIPFDDGKTIIAEIKFDGLDSIGEEYDEAIGKTLPESDCRKVLREKRASINNGDKFYGGKVSKAVKQIREWLDSNGYDRSEVIAFGENLTKNQMKLVFSIKRGLLAYVSDIRFEGNLNITNEELVENFKTCSNDSWKIYDLRKYDFYARTCSRNFLFSKGYFDAKINKINRRPVDGSYQVTIDVNEGVRYRIGKIKIEGAKVFTEKEILEIFGQKEGDIADGKVLQNFVYNRLKRVYADKGYELFNAEFEPIFIASVADGLDATVNLDITIDEGPQFKLLTITFIGVEKEKSQELRKLFSLKDGDIYSQSEMDEGIKKINETEEFYFVEKDQNVEIRTNEESKDIQLLIKLTKIKK